MNDYKHIRKEKELREKRYKKIEGMYYNGYTIEQMINEMRTMDKLDVIRIIQTIEAKKHLKIKVRV